MDIKKGFSKVKNFGKEHWKEILGTCVVLGSGAAIIWGIAKDSIKPISTTLSTIADDKELLVKEQERIAKVGWTLGKMENLWDDEDGVMAIINDVAVSDMGKFGEELMKIEGTKPETMTGIIIGLCKDVES